MIFNRNTISISTCFMIVNLVLRLSDTEASKVNNHLIKTKQVDLGEFENNFINQKLLEKNQTFNGKYLLKTFPNKYKRKSVYFTPKQQISFGNNCSNQICYPSLGNLLVGRSNFLYASSTCGIDVATRFCIIDRLNKTDNKIMDRLFFVSENNKLRSFKCEVCDSRDKFHYRNNNVSHRIENVIIPGRPNKIDYEYKWWQAENGKNQVFIQFDLESEFILSNIYIHFKSFPPAAFYIEKSNDYGLTWKPLAYFATNCEDYFPNVPTRSKEYNIPECTSRYSQFDQRELIYRPLSGHSIQDPSVLTEFFKMTNIRLNFVQLFMFGDQLLTGPLPNSFNDVDENDFNLKYYYAIREIRIMGTCFCNGHASVCLPAEGIQYDYHLLNRIVHSKCDCKHNTDGHNCERCKDMYNDLQWKPAQMGSANECKKCECNEHALSCHFSLERYKQTNETSGGVCDCLHNTDGYNCEKCKLGYYHDKSLPFSHPNACKPCKCNIAGSKNFNCHSSSCECKSNVEGEKCDICKDGYWNLTASNEDGCLKCDVEANGTIDNKGCNKLTAEKYDCKLNVEGERCDKCKWGYFGLSGDNEDGCSKCNCPSGFSYSNDCDPITGQCSCKPNVNGQQCNIIDEGYFCSNIDHLTFEAEESIQLNNLTQTHNRQDFENQNILWTGLGYLRSFEGAKFKIQFDNNYETGLFDIYMRYQLKPDLEEIHIRIKNMGLKKTIRNHKYVQKTCTEIKHNQSYIEEKETIIRKYKTASQIYADYCFEKYHSYEIEITVNYKPGAASMYNSATETPSILIDSVVLIPDMKILYKNKNDKKMCDKLQMALTCREKYLSLPKAKSEKCDELMCLVTVTLFGLLPCQCDSMGSYDNNCEFFGGQCSCKPNVKDRRCEKCASSTWGFAEQGCQRCNCDSYGSINNNCDIETGQCECKENSSGKTCNECVPGYFDPPRCRPCECNGFSDRCHSNGTCISCQENTTGPNCNLCKPGYFGSPEDGIPCKPCSCPGVDGKKFEKSCSFNYETNGMKCHCLPGYTGPRCDKCDDLYYGEPLRPSGSCKKYECNKNSVEFDKRTGECLNCLYNTAGFKCDKCKTGYFGNAFNHDCKPCGCNKFGTVNNSVENCDSEFGICQCLPNVIGIKCDECAQNYWNLETGKGCVECDCDPSGTLDNSMFCDTKTGQCVCTPERSGRRCDQCPFGYWGNPHTGCKRCQCSSQGSESQQCDRNTGECNCVSGVVGYYCDTCDRGTIGSAPFCKKCGECFDNWDKTLLKLNDELENLDKKAQDVYLKKFKNVNLTNFYDDYSSVDMKLCDLKQVLNKNENDKDVGRMTSEIERLKNTGKKYKNTLVQINSFDSNITLANTSLWNSVTNYNKLNNIIIDSFRQVVGFRESFLKGARDSINEWTEKDSGFYTIINDTSKFFEEKMSQHLKTINESLIGCAPKYHSFSNSVKKYEQKSNEYISQIQPELNKLNTLICGSQSLDCTDKCGGLLCNHCGTHSNCPNNYMKTYYLYSNITRTINKTFVIKETKFKDYLSKMNSNKISYIKLSDNFRIMKNNLNEQLSDSSVKAKFLEDLKIELYNYGDEYQSKIGLVIKYLDDVFNFNVTELNEDVFVYTLSLIREQEKMLNNSIEFIKSDLRSRRYNFTVNKNYSDPIRFKNDIETLVNETNLIEGFYKKNETSLKNMALLNNETKNDLEHVNKVMERIETNLVKIEVKKSLVEDILLKNNGLDDFEVNTQNDESVIRTKISRTEMALSLAKEKIRKITENLNSLKFDENSMKLNELNQKIANKQKELKIRIEQRMKKIEDLKSKNKRLELQLNKTKTEIYKLKDRTELLRSQIKVNNLKQFVCH